MARPQPGLFVEEIHLHYHLEFEVGPDVDNEAIVAAVTAARQATATLRGPNTVWGFSPRLWDLLAPGQSPATFHEFETINGVKSFIAPATQADVWFWCQGNAYEKVWRIAYDVRSAMTPAATLVREQQAYVPLDDRDPIGFIDGTENPAVDKALGVALVPDDLPGGGGSIVLIQKWVHKLDRFESLAIPAQEGVIGRTIDDSTELDETVMPASSHVSRNVIEDETGEELAIYRRNTPFASMAEVGTMFIGCTAESTRMDEMLARMFGTSGDGLTDHIVRFSTPVSGSYYFAPSMDALTAVFDVLKPDDGDLEAVGAH